MKQVTFDISRFVSGLYHGYSHCFTKTFLTDKSFRTIWVELGSPFISSFAMLGENGELIESNDEFSEEKWDDGTLHSITYRKDNFSIEVTQDPFSILTTEDLKDILTPKTTIN